MNEQPLQPPRTIRAQSGRSWITLGAFVAVSLPFVVALVKVLAYSGPLYLSGDISVIGMATHHATGLHQQLGPFDRFGWNHPGPSLFYLLALPSWLLGSSAKALFVGAVLINASAAVGVVAVVRHRRSPAAALFAAAVVLAEIFILTPTASGTYEISETASGLLLSPWNATVVLIPFLCFVVVVASSWNRSLLSLVGALAIGSFLVQTDISTAPVVGVLFGVALVGFVVQRLRDQRGGLHVADTRPVFRTPGKWVLGVLSFVVVLQWIPPVLQEIQGKPGNLTLIWRFFTAGHAGTPVRAAFDATWAIFGASVYGPQQLFLHIQGGTPRHAVVSALVGIAVVGLAILGIVVGRRKGDRFGAALCAASLIGLIALCVSLCRVVGDLNGYLFFWAVGLIPAGILGCGLVVAPVVRERFSVFGRQMQIGLVAAICAIASVGVVVHVLAAPAPASANDPQVEQLVTMVSKVVPRGATVEVHDDGAGIGTAKLYNLWRFFGLIWWLDANGYHPVTNEMWKAQLGAQATSTGREPWLVTLETWSPDRTRQPDYVGRVGSMAVFITHRTP